MGSNQEEPDRPLGSGQALEPSVAMSGSASTLHETPQVRQFERYFEVTSTVKFSVLNGLHDVGVLVFETFVITTWIQGVPMLSVNSGF